MRLQPAAGETEIPDSDYSATHAGQLPAEDHPAWTLPPRLHILPIHNRFLPGQPVRFDSSRVGCEKQAGHRRNLRPMTGPLSQQAPSPRITGVRVYRCWRPAPGRLLNRNPARPFCCRKKEIIVQGSKCTHFEYGIVARLLIRWGRPEFVTFLAFQKAARSCVRPVNCQASVGTGCGARSRNRFRR